MTLPALPLRARRLAAAACLATAACSGAESGGGKRKTSEGAIDRPTGPPVVEAIAGGYRGGDVAAVGTVRGTLTLPAGDSAAAAPAAVDSAILKDRACTAARPVAPGLDAAIVWLADVRAGKRVPLERRFVIENERCQVSPRVTAAIAGGALNVRSEDRTTHRLRFTRVGSGEVEVTITQVDDGSVVATDKLLVKPGLFEVRCLVHPSMRAYVAAFDHPYFAVATEGGAFELDSVPPGTYKLVAWHERYGTTEGSVTVAPGQPAQVSIAFARK